MFALTATGGVFAYFGQTYQTGADTWELFSTWAALTLPLAFCARSDAVWSAWVIIALTGLALWSRADAGFSPYMNAAACRVHIIAASCAASLPLSLSKIPRHYTGAGNWAIGIATVLTTILVASTAISDVEGSPSPYYFFCLFLGGTTAAVLANGRPFDVFSASVVGLGLNVILFAGLMKLLVSGASANNELGILLVLGVMAALMLGASVKLIVKLSRASTAHGERA
jgi:uncharacterized membrane protein